MIPKCEDCPAGGTCIVQRTGHVAFCGWMRAGGARRARVIAMSAEDPSPLIAASPAPDRPDAGEALRLLRAAERCPFRSRDPGCGCNGVACGLRPAARRIGSLQDCIACQRRYPEP